MRSNLRAAAAALVMMSASPATAQNSAADIPTMHEPLQLQTLMTLSDLWGVGISPDGKWVAFGFSETGAGKRTSRIRLQRVGTEDFVDLEPGGKLGIWAWSPDSKLLAYTAEEGGVPRLRIWSSDRLQSKLIDGVELPHLSRSVLTWSADSRRLIVPLWPAGNVRPRPSLKPAQAGSDARMDGPSVIVHRAPPESEASASTSLPDLGDSACGTSFRGQCPLGSLEVASGRMNSLGPQAAQAGFHEYSPNGRFVAYTIYSGQNPDERLYRYDLMLKDLGSGRERALARNMAPHLGKTCSWAPDGRSIACLTLNPKPTGRGNRDVSRPAYLTIIPVSGGGARVAHDGKGLPVNLVGDQRALWSADSRHLYAFDDDGRLWEAATAGGTMRLVAAFPHHRILRLLSPEHPADIALPSTGASRLAVAAEDTSNSRSGIFEADLRTGQILPLIEREQHMVQATASADSTVVYIASDRKSANNLWLLRPGTAAPQRAGNLNRALDAIAMGDVRQIRWQSATGEALTGALALPPNYQSGQRVPLFVWVYGDKRGSLAIHQFGFSDNLDFNAQMFATRGYAVFFPDIPQHVGTPMQDIVEAVLPGVDAVIEAGYADPERLAVGGHSYGSYTTLSLITHTDRFKAAIISGVVDPDLASFYLKMSPNGISSESWAETGQGLMGGSLWRYPDRYRDNSPIFLFDRIRTPVLIGQGDKDQTTPMMGADAVFVALRRLGQPVEYRLYGGDGHGFGTPANLIDWWDRRFSFLAEKLDLQPDAVGRVIMDQGRARSRRP